MKRVLLLLCLLVCLPAPVQAEEAERAAIREQAGFIQGHRLADGEHTLPASFSENAKIHVEAAEGIGALYLIFDREYAGYTARDPETGEARHLKTEGFLHDFQDIREAFGYLPKALTLTFPQPGALNEVYFFSPGEIPAFVQQWKQAETGQVDLLLFSAHGDDEQLFFAGMLPYYAGELEYEVLVAYLTDHHNCGTLRRHEMLDGLWAVGVRSYPVFGPFGDYYSKSKESACEIHRKNGETEEALLGFVVEQLRKYRPLVAVGHDVKGEYGHGQHQMYAELLCRGIEAAEDPGQYPDMAARFGTWSVPKTYIHLWEKNPIRLNWDRPLHAFSGMTAFQVTQKLGFPCHKSQQWSFSWFLEGYDQASQIPQYSPCAFGLYRSKVGEDREKADLFENLTPYKIQKQRETTRQIRLNTAQIKAGIWETAAKLRGLLTLEKIF